jgi:phosphate-selective porin OprO/OprP
VTVTASAQNVYTISLKWYVNRNVRFMVNYLHGTIDKFGGSNVTSVIGTTSGAGTDVGAKFDALAMRTQIAF